MRNVLFLLLALWVFATGCTYQRPCRVVVIDFENATGNTDFDFLEKALPEYLLTRLANSDKLILLERQKACSSQIKGDGCSDPWLAKSLKRAQYVIAGSVSRLERNFILTARICNAYNGQIIPGTAITQTCVQEREIYSRVQNMADFLAAQLRVRGVVTPLTRNLPQAPTAESRFMRGYSPAG
ncbi:hypothetical protein HQ520_07720 [bacterium]|nr:hypothetical protein [bacterium]